MSGSEPKTGDESGRISIRVSPEIKAALQEIMRLGKMRSLADAVRRSIGDELFLQQQMEEGWHVLLEKDNKYREIKWSNQF
jgi:hypothetical protein